MSETIINGIDVSECEFCKTHPNSAVINSCNSRGFFKENGLHIHINCKDNPNCYFKQFKRLQEENEKLKNKNNDLIEEIASGNIDIAILQKENEKLKKENEQLKQPCLVMPKVNQLAVPIEKYEQLYKALEKIREIAQYSIMHNSELNLNYQTILQIINEVLNDN